MESQRVNVQASFSVGTKPSSTRNASQNQGVDPYILAALNTEDRFYILELGNVFEALIMNQRAFMSFSPPSSPSHYRQLAIFCAIYYNLMPDHDFLTGGLLVFKTASSRIPPIRLLDLAHPKRIPPPPIHHRGLEEQSMDGAVIEHPLQPNVQPNDNLDVPAFKTFLLTPPPTPLSTINHPIHLSASPSHPSYLSSTSPQKANSTIITNSYISSETTSTAPSTTGGIEIRTCGRPLNPHAPHFVPAHLRTGFIAPQRPMHPTWTPGLHTSSSTRRTRIDAKFLPDWRSSSTEGHGGLDDSLRSRRKLFTGSSSTTSGSSSVNFIDWMSVSTHSGTSSP